MNSGSKIGPYVTQNKRGTYPNSTNVNALFNLRYKPYNCLPKNNA